MIRLTYVTDISLSFEISSSTRDSTHDVYWDVDDGWVCTCEHSYYRKVECKHIQACKDYLQQEKKFTIVGVTVNKVLEYNTAAINHITRMGTFYEIKNKREAKKWNYQQEMKLKA